jgi:hypothetical protein
MSNVITAPFASGNTAIATTMIDTPVLKLELNPVRRGDTEISWTSSLFSSGLMSGIAQVCAREAANELVNLRTSLFTDAEIAEDKCRPLSECFENGSLVSELTEDRTPSQVMNLENRYAFYLGICDVALDLDAAWKKFFENSPGRRDTAPQYGLRPNPRFVEGRSAEPRFEPILSFEDAVQHFLDSNTRIKAIKARFTARKGQIERQEELSSKTVEERRAALRF